MKSLNLNKLLLTTAIIFSAVLAMNFTGNKEVSAANSGVHFQNPDDWYTNLCGGPLPPTSYSSYNCPANCSPQNGTCTGVVVHKYVCTGELSECNMGTQGFKWFSVSHDGQPVSLVSSPNGVRIEKCNQTVQLDVYDKDNGKLTGFMVWYTGICTPDNDHPWESPVHYKSPNDWYTFLCGSVPPPSSYESYRCAGNCSPKEGYCQGPYRVDKYVCDGELIKCIDTNEFRNSFRWKETAYNTTFYLDTPSINLNPKQEVKCNQTVQLDVYNKDGNDLTGSMVWYSGGCGRSTPTPTPTVAPTSTPTATPTSTGAPTSTPTTTPTSTANPTDNPTSTPEPGNGGESSTPTPAQPNVVGLSATSGEDNFGTMIFVLGTLCVGLGIKTKRNHLSI